MSRVLSILGAVLVLAVAAVSTVATAQPTEPPTRALAPIERPDPPHIADFNNLGRWPVDDPVLCLLDKTHGFPVEQAASEFDDFVTMFVQAESCPDFAFVVEVETCNDPDGDYTGWFSSQRNDDGTFASGMITLNLARAYKMDPRMWRLVLVHELGHAVGLEHTWEYDSIMYEDARVYEVDGLTHIDRMQLAEIYGGAES